MTRNRDVGRMLDLWLAEGVNEVNDRVLDAVEEQIGRERQLPVWRVPGRNTAMNRAITVAVGLAAAIVIAVVGYNALPRQPGIGAPSPRPSPTVLPSSPPSAAPSAFVCEEGTGCAGLLAAGTHATAQFAPALTYTTPSDWMNPIDSPTLVGITPVDRPADLILVWSGVQPAETGSSCELQAKPGAGTTVDDWIAFLDAHPGLDATNIQSHAIGGATARSIDIRSYGGWTSPCESDRERFNVPLLKTAPGGVGDGYGVAIGAEARVYAIDAGGETVIVTVYSYGGNADAFQEAVDLAEPVVNSFAFDRG